MISLCKIEIYEIQVCKKRFVILSLLTTSYHYWFSYKVLVFDTIILDHNQDHNQIWPTSGVLLTLTLVDLLGVVLASVGFFWVGLVRFTWLFKADLDVVLVGSLDTCVPESALTSCLLLAFLVVCILGVRRFLVPLLCFFLDSLLFRSTDELILFRGIDVTFLSFLCGLCQVKYMSL